MKGRVYKRGKTYTYVFDGPPNLLTGERQQLTKGGWLTEKEAWKKCREAIKRLEEGKHVRSSKQTLGQYLVEEWLPAIKTATSGTTWGNWKVFATSYVVPVLGKVKLQALTAPHIQSLYEHLLQAGRIKTDLSWAMYDAWKKLKIHGKEPQAKQIAELSDATIQTVRAAVKRFQAGHIPVKKNPGLEPKTVRNVHTMLHKALADAVAWKYLTENVAAHARPPKSRRRKPSVWTAQQLRTFLDHVRADRFYAMYHLAAMTGFRRGELCGLRWPAIDLETGTVSVEPDTLVVVNGHAVNSDGKTDNAPRLLSLDDATINALREWQAVQQSERVFFDRDYHHTDRVFTWENGRDIHPDVVRQRFLRFVQQCGLPRIRLHDMRHTYATIALKSGVNPKIVSARLGHASVGFTLSVYSHALPGYDRDAAHSVANLILGPTKETETATDNHTPPKESM